MNSLWIYIYFNFNNLVKFYIEMGNQKSIASAANHEEN